MTKRTNRLSRMLAITLAVMVILTSMNFGMWGGAETAWAAEEDVIEISTAAEFAAMDPAGNYKLTNDIVVTTPYKSTFKGTFDGDGHTITLQLNVTTPSNVGLFAKTDANATIRNLIVDADIMSSVASSSYGTGGIIGQVYGATTIQNCGVQGKIHNTTTANTSVYVGGIVGYQQDKLTLSNCYSNAQIISDSAYYASSSSATGGLVGRGSTYAIIAENCYMNGEISGNNYVGGIVGYGASSSSKKHSYTNVYSTAKVSGNKAYGFMYNSQASTCELVNCYYNSDSSQGFNAETTGLQGKTSDELKQLAEEGNELSGGAFMTDATSEINGGYPILTWQYIDPDEPHTVTFHVTPATSVLIWNDKEQSINDEGICTIPGVTAGQYTYSVTNAADDYDAQSGMISVKGKDVTKKIDLQLKKYNLTFNILDSEKGTVVDDAALIVRSGETVLSPSAGTYTVARGTYRYEASAFGYQTVSDGEVVVEPSIESNQTKDIALTKQPLVTVTFSYNYGKYTDPVRDSKIEVSTEDGRKMVAQEGTDGFVYELPAGYSYTYKFTSANYARQSGSLDYTSVTAAKEEAVTVPMTPKTAWEGAGDIAEPSKDADGVYQISSGSELAWLAQQVNSEKNADCNAVLTKDIDLGNENWTPIGKTGNPFKDIFDGQGHTIKNIKIEGSTSSNYGLFGYIDGGTIRNLTVDGTITITGSGSSIYGIAAVAGKVSGNSILENCVNRAAVTGNYNVGGIAGYTGGSAGQSIKNCVNLNAITGTYNVGGVVGQLYGEGNIEYCYNRAIVTTKASKAGGIAGYLTGKGVINSCYSTGNISGNSSAAAIAGSVSTSSTVKNCFYLDGVISDTNATSKTSDELKSLAPTLGGDFLTAPEGLNDGYPILKFQIPTYDVKFTVNDAAATVVIEGKDGKQDGKQDGNTWSFSLSDGTYRYIVSAYGMLSQSGEFAIEGASFEKEIILKEAPTKKITFDIKPANSDAAVTIMQNGQAVKSGAAGVYTLPYGTYTYLVKAKGYAKVSDSLTVNEDSEGTITITLTPSTAWDGETKAQPTGAGTESRPYQIEDGEQLAWLADAVNNASAVTSLYAVLSDDINLGNESWIPIGSDSRVFQGVFDGQGYTVSGLNVTDVESAGLFGVVSGAEIKNLIVSGSVSGTRYAGGIAGKVRTAVSSFVNCGNEAEVTGAYAAGILGTNMVSSGECRIVNCYNTGKIVSNGSSSDRAGGIYAGSSSGKTSITGCYNVGDVSSNGNAGGIYGQSGSFNGTVSFSYNSGKVKGASEKVGAITSGSAGVGEACYYLNGSAVDNSTAAAVSSMELQQLAISDDFEHVNGRNKNYPVLKWQKLKEKAGEAVLAENAEFQTEKVPMTSTAETDDENTYRLTTPKLTWSPIEGADRYVVTIWRNGRVETASDVDDISNFLYWEDEEAAKYLTAEQLAEYKTLKDTTNAPASAGSAAAHPKAAYLQKIFKEQDLTLPSHYELGTSFVTAIYDVIGTEYDCTSLFDELPEGVYYAAVAAMDADGDCKMPTLSTIEEEVVGWQNPYDRLKKVTGLAWDGTKAVWNGKDHFTENEIYTIKLYTVDGDGSEAKDYKFFKSFEVNGIYYASDFKNMFAAETNYAFTITAHTSQDYQIAYGLTDSPESDMSPVYTAGSSEAPSDDHEGWIAISSAADWIKLANVKDELSDPTDTSSPSKQEIEWGKNYYLTADIDFSTLSAADQAKTKSIGNVTNRFMGTLDGNGYKIKGLTLSNSDAGLFWYVGSTGYIYDLIIENANVLFSDNAAVIAQMNYGKIENCGVINCNITADIGAVMGGMVSRNYGIIRNSYVQGGSLDSNSKTATGHAGFVGANEAGALIERCWTSMNVKTTSDYAGGFVGLGYGGTIRDCFALGNVSARSYSGGFIGRSVYDGNTYENCYAAGKVTVSGTEGHGFIGGNKPDSSFQYDQSSGIQNCYYNAASPEDQNGAAAKTLSEMKEASFLAALNRTANWSQDADKNNGLPYLTDVKVPEKLQTSEITVELALATYDKTNYEFKQKDKTIRVTMQSNGNTRLVDLMDEAAAQGLLTYAYDTTASFGRFIKTINDYSIESPDGWMFTINDTLSNVSASLATVKDGDKVLWFEGTTENRFQGPTWDELENPQIVWTDIRTLEELEAFAASTDAETLAKNYRLMNDIDFGGKAFAGIGDAAHPFTGIFDGKNHTISNFTISGTGEGTGFFHVIKGATIKNLKLENVSVNGQDKVGTLVGWAQVQLDPEDASKNIANLIGNCSASGSVSGTQQVGGLVGLNDGETDEDTLFSIASSVNKAAFSGTVTGIHQIGGLVGENKGTITQGEASGAVKTDTGAANAATAGGLVGDNTGSIYDSNADAAVSGNNVVGGFVGYSDGIIKNAYSTGNVQGSSYVGSFAGSISKAENVIGAGTVTVSAGSQQGYAGGFAGNMGGTIAGAASQITIKNAFGNCVSGDGTILGTVGNSNAFTSDGQKEILKDMGLTTSEAVRDKLFEMFGVWLDNADDSELEDILAKIDTAVTAGISNTVNTPWQIADLTAYADLYTNGQTGLSAEKQQELLNYIIAQAAETTKAGDLAKYIIALKAMGYDARKVVTVNTPAGTYFDLLAELKQMMKNKTGYADSIYTLPYILIAFQQDDAYATKAEINALIKQILDQQLTSGGWGYQTESGEVLDFDATAPILLALSKYYNTDADVKTALDKVLTPTVIATAQGKTGAIYSSWNNASTPSAETTGLVLAGLAACGKDYTEYKVGDKTLVDGLMNMLNKNKNGFLHDGQSDEMATEQGFRGLLAAVQAKKTGSAYRIYDFSNKSANIAKATGKGSSDKPSEPIGTTEITVYLTVKTDTETWLERAEVVVKNDATVYHAFTSGLAATADMSENGAADGYVKSITKGGTTLAEFDKGQNSGWLYKVNNVLPKVPLTSYRLSDGDEILWYYTVDYKQDPAAGSWEDPTNGVTTTENSGSAVTTSPTEVKVVEKTAEDGTKVKVAEVTVSDENQKEIIKQAKENKSAEIILDVTKDAVGDAASADIKLDKSFLESIVKDTNAKLTIKTPFGDKTYTQDELKALLAGASGTTVTLTIEKSEELDDAAKLAQAKEQLAKVSLTARSVKTSKKNVKVTLKLNAESAAAIKEIQSLGYTVKYKYYRSTKKASKYAAKITKTSKSYINTAGAKGSKYYYKARVLVYDQNGKLVTYSKLTQCKYAARIWTK